MGHVLPDAPDVTSLASLTPAARVLDRALDRAMLRAAHRLGPVHSQMNVQTTSRVRGPGSFKPSPEHAAGLAVDKVFRPPDDPAGLLPLYRDDHLTGLIGRELADDPAMTQVLANHAVILVTEPDATGGTGYGHYHAAVDSYTALPDHGMPEAPGLHIGALLIDANRRTQHYSFNHIESRKKPISMYDNDDQRRLHGGIALTDIGGFGRDDDDDDDGGIDDEIGGADDDDDDDEGGFEEGAFDQGGLEEGGCPCTGDYGQGGLSDATLAKRMADAIAEEAEHGGVGPGSDDVFDVGALDGTDDGGPRRVRGKRRALWRARKLRRQGARRVRVRKVGKAKRVPGVKSGAGSTASRERGNIFATSDVEIPVIMYQKTDKFDIKVYEAPKLSQRISLQQVLDQFRQDASDADPPPTLLRNVVQSAGAPFANALAPTTGVRTLPYFTFKLSGAPLTTTTAMIVTLRVAYMKRGGAPRMFSLTMELKGLFANQPVAVHPFDFSADMLVYAPGILNNGGSFVAGVLQPPAILSTNFTGIDSGVKCDLSISGVRDDGSRELFQWYRKAAKTWK